MAEVASAYVSLLPSLQGFGRRLSRDMGPTLTRAGQDGGKRLSDGMATSVKSNARRIFAPLAGAVAGLGALSFFKEAIAGASDLQEAGTKTEAVFGQAGQALVEAFSSRGAEALGQTKLEILDAASSFGIFGKAAGLQGKALADFSTGFASLSTDMASFFNSSPEEAVQAIGSALRGEAEPIRKFGVLLDDATLKSEALRLGLLKPVKDAPKIAAATARLTIAQANYNKVLKKHGKDSIEFVKAQASLGAATSAFGKATDGTVPKLNAQQRVLAAQAVIYKQTKDAQGDFQKTSGGLANQQRILQAKFKDLRSELGQRLLPSAVKVVSFLNDKFLPGVVRVGAGIKGVATLLRNGDFTGSIQKAFGWAEDSKPIDYLFRLRDGFLKARDMARAFFDGVTTGNTGWAAPLEKFAVAGDKVRTAIGFADKKVRQFGGWLKSDLFPALRSAADTIFPALGEAWAIISGGSGQDGAKGAGEAFRKFGEVLTEVIIPTIALLVRAWLPIVATNIRIVIEAVKLVTAAFSLFKTTVDTVVAFIIRRIADAGAGFAVLLDVLGRVPGFGWAKDAAEAIRGVVQEARNVAREIDNLDGMSATIAVNLKPQQGRLTVGTESLNIGLRARGGPVKRGEPYIVGEKRPELFVPNQSGKIIPKVPEGSAGEGSGTSVRIGTVVAHDYDDFVRQMQARERREAILGF